jgi:hypothetical protein
MKSVLTISCMPSVKCPGTPDAGNPHVRCDEGGGGSRASSSTLLVLSWPDLFLGIKI